MRVQILTNAEKMFIEDTPFEAGELQFVYLVDVDKIFPALNLELEKVSYVVLCQVVNALAADGDFHHLAGDSAVCVCRACHAPVFL